MQQLERAASNAGLRTAREEMAAWYRPVGVKRLCGALSNASLAPGTAEGLALLRAMAQRSALRRSPEASRSNTLLDSSVWSTAWAPSWKRPAASATSGRRTRLHGCGNLAHRLDVPLKRTAAVGDSMGDAEMLRTVGIPVFIGRPLPAFEPTWRHYPAADIAEIARHLVAAWKLPPNNPQPTGRAARASAHGACGTSRSGCLRCMNEGVKILLASTRRLAALLTSLANEPDKFEWMMSHATCALNTAS